MIIDANEADSDAADAALQAAIDANTANDEAESDAGDAADAAIQAALMLMTDSDAADKLFNLMWILTKQTQTLLTLL